MRDASSSSIASVGWATVDALALILKAGAGATNGPAPAALSLNIQGGRRGWVGRAAAFVVGRRPGTRSGLSGAADQAVGLNISGATAWRAVTPRTMLGVVPSARANY